MRVNTQLLLATLLYVGGFACWAKTMNGPRLPTTHPYSKERFMIVRPQPHPQLILVTPLVPSSPIPEVRQFDHAAFLVKVANVESAQNPGAVGDGGKARGLYQFHRRTWEHVSQIRKAEGAAVYAYQPFAHSVGKSTEYALTYSRWLEQALSSRLGYADEQLIYAAWNAGITKLLAAQGDLRRMPPITRRVLPYFDRH